MTIQQINALLRDYEAAAEALTLARSAKASAEIVRQRAERLAEVRSSIATRLLHSQPTEV